MSAVSLPDREECYETFRQARFGEEVFCIECGSPNIVKRGITSKDAQRYHCKDCDNYFNDLTNTVFQSRTTSIEEFAFILERVDTTPPESIANQLGKDTHKIIEFVNKVKSSEKGYLKAFRGPRSLDFSLLMAGDLFTPFVDEEKVDPTSDAFSHWVMNLAYDE